MPLPSRLALPVLLFITACDRPPPITSCSDDLHGVWRAPSGRWAVIDYGAKLEVFALFDDTQRREDVLAAPRAIDLVREPKLTGEVKRRFSRGADHCDGRAPARVTKCEGGALQVVLAEPTPPLSFAPCTWGSPATSRVERWVRD